MIALPPIFVISLPGSPRRNAIAGHLAHWRGRWDFIDAVNGYDLSRKELDAVYDVMLTRRAIGRSMSLPEIGCALSHRIAYERILRDGLDSAIVLEDDAVLKDAFFRYPFEQIDFAFDVISFYSRALVHAKPEPLGPVFALHRAAGYAPYTVGYLVSARGAARLHDATAMISYEADWPIPPERMDLFVCAESLLEHSASDSTIEASRAALSARPFHGPGSLREWITEGNMQYLTVPLFIHYLLRRDSYLDAEDYFRREILYRARLMLPWRYRLLDHVVGSRTRRP